MNKADPSGATPLFKAAEKGREKVVNMLLKKPGIEVNRADITGATPISVAADNRHGGVVNLLLGTDEIRQVGWDGWRPNANPA